MQRLPAVYSFHRHIGKRADPGVEETYDVENRGRVRTAWSCQAVFTNEAVQQVHSLNLL